MCANVVFVGPTFLLVVARIAFISQCRSLLWPSAVMMSLHITRRILANINLLLLLLNGKHFLRLVTVYLATLLLGHESKLLLIHHSLAVV
jgi:hypothetical protein